MTEEYPECEKWAKAHDVVMAVSEFMEFIGRKGWRLAEYKEDGELFPICKQTDSLLCEFVGVDEKKLETERRAMLEKLRKGDVK
jgi:hypothetical protein